MQKLIKLHPLDNVQVLVDEIKPGEQLVINGVTIEVEGVVGIGHKIADRLITAGEKIIKYGVSIGSATTTIDIGGHVHLHNMKSNYIPTYTIERRDKDNNN